MSIFGAIRSVVFGNSMEAAPAQAAPAQSAPQGGQTTGDMAPISRPAPVQQAAPQQAPATEAEIEARLDAIAQSKGIKSNYKVSIVDLMRLLDLDTSMANRIELAKELGYTGDTNDSATMNIWLHKQVMASLATRGQ